MSKSMALYTRAKAIKIFWTSVLIAVLTACGGGGGGGGSPDNGSASYNISGTVSSLNGTLVLQNNAKDDTSITGNGAGNVSFTFASKATAYAVTVKTNPQGQSCTIANGTGTALADVTSVAISCISANSIGGTVAGLGKGQSVVLKNGTDEVEVKANGDFAFNSKIATGSQYTVSVKTQPLGLSCSVTTGNGYSGTSDIKNVAVNCAIAPVAMPTLADYGGGRKAYSYDIDQTGSSLFTKAMIIYPDGKIDFLDDSYDSVTDFFDDAGTAYSKQPCATFPLYVGKSGTCTRPYGTKGATDTQNWVIDSVVDVTVLGKSYKGFKIVADDVNTVNGNWTQTAIYVPDLKIYSYVLNQKNDGTLRSEMTLTSLP